MGIWCTEYSALHPLKDHHLLQAKIISRSEQWASEKVPLGFDFLCFAKRTSFEQSAMWVIFFHISDGGKKKRAPVQSVSWDTGRNKTAYTTRQSHLPSSKNIKALPLLNTCVASLAVVPSFLLLKGRKCSYLFFLERVRCEYRYCSQLSVWYEAMSQETVNLALHKDLKQDEI